IAGFNSKKKNVVSLRYNIQSQLVCSSVYLPHIQGTTGQPFEKVAAAVALIFLDFSVKLFIIFLLAFLILIPVSDLAESFKKSIFSNRLQQVIFHTNADCLFRIIKIIISA